MENRHADGEGDMLMVMIYWMCNAEKYPCKFKIKKYFPLNNMGYVYEIMYSTMCGESYV